MADNDDIDAGEGRAAAPPRSKKKLVIIVAAALIMIGGGAGGYFAFFRHAEPAVKLAEPPKPPVFVDMPELLVNLAGNPGDRVQYLKMKIVLEVKDQPLATAIAPALPRVMDIFQTYLRELRPADLNGSGGIYRLKEELARRINAVLSPNEINAVLFKEVVVQ